MNGAVTSQSNKRYRGNSTDQRRADRRCRLIQAAIATYGQRGFQNTTVKAVCDAAGLTERYFYESFSNSEALLIATFAAVNAHVMERLKQAGSSAGADPAAQAKAMLKTYFETLENDPPSAKVFLVEIRGVSDAVDAVLHQAIETSADLLFNPRQCDAYDPLVGAGLVGAVLQIALTWIASGYARSVDEVTQVALRICEPALASLPIAQPEQR